MLISLGIMVMRSLTRYGRRQITIGTRVSTSPGISSTRFVTETERRADYDESSFDSAKTKTKRT